MILLTNLGWVCFGPASLEEVQKSNSRSHTTRTYRSSSSSAETELLNESLRRFWDIEIHEEKKQLHPCMDPNRFLSFRRLVRVTGWIKRFLRNCRLPKDSRETSTLLKTSEITEAQYYWFQYAHADAFGDKDKDVMKLNEQKDQHDILRSNGRLCYAEDLPYHVRHPIILPKCHAVTRLVITDAHERIGHGTGVEHLTELRARILIVKGRRNLRNIIESCGEQ